MYSCCGRELPETDFDQRCILAVVHCTNKGVINFQRIRAEASCHIDLQLQYLYDNRADEKAHRPKQMQQVDEST